jgi:hypothetical protein
MLKLFSAKINEFHGITFINEKKENLHEDQDIDEN